MFLYNLFHLEFISISLIYVNQFNSYRETDGTNKENEQNQLGFSIVCIDIRYLSGLTYLIMVQFYTRLPPLSFDFICWLMLYG